jgi:hypothetical protein
LSTRRSTSTTTARVPSMLRRDRDSPAKAGEVHSSSEQEAPATETLRKTREVSPAGLHAAARMGVAEDHPHGSARQRPEPRTPRTRASPTGARPRILARPEPCTWATPGQTGSARTTLEPPCPRPEGPRSGHQAQIKPTPPPERPASRRRHGSARPARQDAIVVAAEPPPAVGVVARLQSHCGRAERHKSRRPLHRRRPASTVASSGGDERWGGTGRGPAEVDFRVSPPCLLEEATQERGEGGLLVLRIATIQLNLLISCDYLLVSTHALLLPSSQ